MNKVLLVERFFENENHLDFNSFVDMVKADKNTAISTYNDIYFWPAQERYNNKKNEHLAKVVERSTKIANDKYKTERGRTNYINRCVAKVEETYPRFHFTTLDRIDFDFEPGHNYISNNCILTLNKNEHFEEDIMKLYDEIINNKYFRAAKGWRWYNVPCSRPHVELILPEYMDKMFHEEKMMLESAIMDFYGNGPID